MGAKSYFISDLHLGAPYISDPRAHEARIVSWLEAIAPDAARLYMLGDVMDYWYEYRTVAPRGHVRFLGALARLADSGCEIVWLKGNHDIWIFDYLPREIGLRVVDGTFTCASIGNINGSCLILPQKTTLSNVSPLTFQTLLSVIYSNLSIRML